MFAVMARASASAAQAHVTARARQMPVSSDLLLRWNLIDMIYLTLQPANLEMPRRLLE